MSKKGIFDSQDEDEERRRRKKMIFLLRHQDELQWCVSYAVFNLYILFSFGFICYSVILIASLGVGSRRRFRCAETVHLLPTGAASFQ